VARAALVCAAGSLGLVAVLARRANGAGLPVVLATMLLLMPAVTGGGALVASGRAVAGLAGGLARRIGPGDLLLHEGPIENSGGLEFYSGRRPVLVDARQSVLGIGATLPEARGTFWDASDLARAWRSDRRVFLVTPRAPGRSLVAGLPTGSVHLLESGNGRWLYSNADPRAGDRGGGAGPVAAPSSSGLR
jgi:hypothetical protein